MMTNKIHHLTRREFAARLAQAGVALSLWPAAQAEETPTPALPDPLLTFPGPWAFNLPKGAIILVNDQQLEDLQDPDKEVDISLTATPNRTTLRKICEQNQASGAKTLILAFDHFWAQYRAGQGEKPRRLMPDTDDYIRVVGRLSETLKKYGLGLELSLLSPLELGPGYRHRTGEQGRWVQYREGLRDPRTGTYEVQLWQQNKWTNNKGTIEIKRTGLRVFAFRERRVGGTPYYVVNPDDIRELRQPPTVKEWSSVTSGNGIPVTRLSISGAGEAEAGGLDRVVVVAAYETPELDYFSPQALPFLKDLVERYHRAGIPLNGLYSDEMHIQQDWAYHGHHDEGQFTFRYLTPNLAKAFAAQYGAEFADLEKYLVYFAYGQHGFYGNLEARLPAQHVLGAQSDEIQRTFLLRRRYFDLLGRTVVGLFQTARLHAEQLYGHELEARAHATWAQSPTIDSWVAGNTPHAPRQYEYTSNFLWSNTVHQSAAACDDYFLWNDFLTGGGNDHTEGGWLDRDYYALALACSTGLLNRVPYAYAAHWGMPQAVSERRQALVEAYGAAASPPFQAIENSEHREAEVLMLYPLSLVACEERFGSWMVQYGYANYVTPQQLLARGEVAPGGKIKMAGLTFSTVVVLFEPLPPAGLLPFLEKFTAAGGRLVWSGPPPRLDMAGAGILARWMALCGVKAPGFQQQGILAPGEMVQFDGSLAKVPAQTILTDFLVDHIYPVAPAEGAEIVARVGRQIVGVRRPGAGQVVFLGFRPRDDQAASLGYEVRTWFEVLKTLGAYPASDPQTGAADNPAIISRESPWLACHFPNGTLTVAAHYRHHVESWSGGFHRDAKQDQAAVERNPLGSDRLELNSLAIQGHRVSYQGRLVVAFRPGPGKSLLAFGGYDCRGITVDGREYAFADRPLGQLAWAPVAENRQVPGGARLELWVSGEAKVRIPLPPGIAQGRLISQNRRSHSPGREIPSRIQEGCLCFEAKPGAAQGHLFLV